MMTIPATLVEWYNPYQDIQWDGEAAERYEIRSLEEEELYLNWSFRGTCYIVLK